MAKRFTKYPKGYIKASIFLPLGEASNITKYAMDYLDRGKKVYIESGALNDVITAYTVNQGYDRGWTRDYDEVLFTSEGGYFGNPIDLSAFSYVDCEEFDGNLFIQVN